MKYACKVYWEQSCEVEIESPTKLTKAQAAELAVEKAEEEIAKLAIRQDVRRKFRLNEVIMVVDSVNCDPETDVQKVES